MKVHNKSRRTYQHSELDAQGQIRIIEIRPDEIKEISDKIAQVWLNTGDVVEYADPKEQAELQEENAKLKAQLEALKGNKIDELKKEADKLGIKYQKNIGAEKLAEKIKAFKEQ